MKKYVVKTPKIVKHIFNNWKWKFSKEEKIIYLTFDDGPTPKITNWILNELEKYCAKATFFCLGKNVANNPDLAISIINNGHSLGNHTYNHFNGLHTKTEEYLADVNAAENTIQKITKKKTNLFRPPYGKIKFYQSKKIRKKGYKIIMWDVLSADFDTTISSKQCLHNVIKNTESGSIITFHDSEKASKNLKFALPEVLKYYSEKGYVFENIS